MVHQVTAPLLGSLVWSSAIAILPILLLFILLGCLGWRAERATLAALAAALLIALAVYGVAPVQSLNIAAYGGAFGLISVAWVILNAIWLYELTVRSGHFEALRQVFASMAGAPPVQMLLIAFGFGGLLEGLIGAGAPVAICSAMLVAIGLPPMQAAICTLLADSVPVAFGTLALPIIALSSATGLPVTTLGAMVGRQTPILAMLIPFILLILVGGRRALRAHWRIAFLAGLSFGFTQFAVSNYLSVKLADVIAALVASAVLVATVRLAPNGMHEPEMTRENAIDPRRMAQALAPYGIIILVFSLAQIPALTRVLAVATVSFDWPGLAILSPDGAAIATRFKLPILETTGTLLLLSGVITMLVLRLSPRLALRAYRDAAYQIRHAVITVAAIFALAFVANLSGQTRTMGLLLATLGPTGFALVSPLIGWIGAALTGSDSSSNVLFGGLQTTAAQGVGMSPILAAASNSSGGVVAKAISVQSLAVASATVSLVGKEAAILRRVIFWSLGLLMLMCAISLFQSLPFISGWVVPSLPAEPVP